MQSFGKASHHGDKLLRRPNNVAVRINLFNLWAKAQDNVLDDRQHEIFDISAESTLDSAKFKYLRHNRVINDHSSGVTRQAVATNAAAYKEHSALFFAV